MNIPFSTQLVIIGVFTFLMYFLVFRKYRSLGLRLFFVFSMISLMTCFWFYNDLQEQKLMDTNGHLLKARVTKKWTERSGENSIINLIETAFEYPKGQLNRLKTSEFISTEEHNTLKIGQNIEILYSSIEKRIYYTVSYNRYKNDQWIFYALPIFYFVLGGVLWYFLRNFNVGVHTKTGEEYLERNGKIVLDEQRNGFAKTMKKVNIVSKLFQILK